MYKPRRLLVLTLAVALAGLGPAALAVDSTPAAGDKLATARNLIKAEQWRAAIAELQTVDDTGSADWNNLMGYAQRKSSPPDLAAAERYYDAALRIDPKHRGALEYSGELHLMKGELPKAEERLKALDRACFLPCEEYSDLKRSIARYKANGNRYVPQ